MQRKGGFAPVVFICCDWEYDCSDDALCGLALRPLFRLPFTMCCEPHFLCQLFFLDSILYLTVVLVFSTLLYILPDACKLKLPSYTAAMMLAMSTMSTLGMLCMGRDKMRPG